MPYLGMKQLIVSIICNNIIYVYIICILNECNQNMDLQIAAFLFKLCMIRPNRWQDVYVNYYIKYTLAIIPHLGICT